MTAKTARFRLVLLALSTALALALSLAFAAAVSANNQSYGPTNLTAELCGDAVCLSWTPGSGGFDVNQVQVWEGDNAVTGSYYGSMAVDEDGQARIPVHYLFIREPQSSGDTVDFSFQVLVIKYDNYYGVSYAAKSNLVTLDIPRPGSDPIVLDVDLNPPDDAPEE